MNDFSFGKKGRKLFSHNKRQRPYIEGEDFIDCFDAYGIQEPNIELPSDFNNFELHEESSLEAIPTDFEKSDIRPNSDGENAAVFVNPFVIFIRGAKMLQGNNKMV